MSLPRKLCTMKELKTVYGIPYCRQHIYRLIKALLFPAPIRLGTGRIAFWCDEVGAWVDARPRAF